MTMRTFKTITAGALLAAFTAAATPSQAGQITAKVPFSFSVNSSAPLPPGDYTLSTTDGLGTVLVRGATGASFSVTNRMDSRGEDTPKLVFHKYGDTYILRQVWMGGGVGRALPRPRLERELQERKVAGTLQPVTVAAK